jgi:hypothetical protein
MKLSVTQFISLFAILFFWSCQPPLDQAICQAWQANDLTLSPDFEQTLARSADDRRKRLRAMLTFFLNQSDIRFYPSGQYGQLAESRYGSGQWSLQGDLLTIKNQTGTYSCQVSRPNGESLRLTMVQSKDIPNGALSFTLRSHAEYELESIDLLAPARNQWRHRSARPESFAELRQRLTDHMSYVVDYFELTNRPGQTYFNTAHLASPFKFYQNGVGLLPLEELPPEWWAMFHDVQNAQQAYALLATVFQSSLRYPSGEKTYTLGYAKFLRGAKTYLLAQTEDPR